MCIWLYQSAQLNEQSTLKTALLMPAGLVTFARMPGSLATFLRHNTCIYAKCLLEVLLLKCCSKCINAVFHWIHVLEWGFNFLTFHAWLTLPIDCEGLAMLSLSTSDPKPEIRWQLMHCPLRKLLLIGALATSFRYMSAISWWTVPDRKSRGFELPGGIGCGWCCS